jgi:hypothetical protein
MRPWSTSEDVMFSAVMQGASLKSVVTYEMVFTPVRLVAQAGLNRCIYVLLKTMSIIATLPPSTAVLGTTGRGATCVWERPKTTPTALRFLGRLCRVEHDASNTHNGWRAGWGRCNICSVGGVKPFRFFNSYEAPKIKNIIVDTITQSNSSTILHGCVSNSSVRDIQSQFSL